LVDDEDPGVRDALAGRFQSVRLRATSLPTRSCKRCSGLLRTWIPRCDGRRLGNSPGSARIPKPFAPCSIGRGLIDPRMREAATEGLERLNTM